MEAFSILQWWEAKATDFPVPAALAVAFTQMIPLPGLCLDQRRLVWDVDRLRCV